MQQFRYTINEKELHMNHYKRLSPVEREELALQLALGLSLRLIAKLTPLAQRD